MEVPTFSALRAGNEAKQKVAPFCFALRDLGRMPSITLQLGAHKAIRTPDLFLTKEVLYLLSYMSLKSSSPCFLPNVLERVAGIEPASSAWKAEVIASIRHPQILFFLAQNDILYIRVSFLGLDNWSGPII